MPVILHRQPIPRQERFVVVGPAPVRLRADQIIVWLGLSTRPRSEPPARNRCFPAVLDTGHNHFLSIRAVDLRNWAGLSPDTMQQIGEIRERGRTIPLRAAALFIYSNLRGREEPDFSRSPTHLELPRGIAVYDEGDFPRLPLLGLRAVLHNRLRLTIDGTRMTATLTRPTLWWPFG